MKCYRNREVQYRYSAPHQHGTESLKCISQPVGYSQQKPATKHTDKYTPNFIDPLLINSILDEEPNSQHQDSNTDFVRKIFSDKFFEIRIPFKKARCLRFRSSDDRWSYRLCCCNRC